MESQLPEIKEYLQTGVATIDDQPFRIISTNEFYDYTIKWQSLLHSNPEGLDGCFRPNSQFLNYMYLKSEDVMMLLSSVATSVIRMDFAVVPLEEVPSPEPAQSVFALVLYGEDSNGKRTSGYFRAAIPSHTGHIDELTHSAANRANTVAGEATMPFEPLPYDLAVRWTKAWQPFANEKITNELFNTIYTPEQGYLRGYAYPIKDFLLAISTLSADSNQWLKIIFGVHAYSKPDANPSDTISKLFDTIITVDAADNAIRLTASQSYYDVSMPSPPYH